MMGERGFPHPDRGGQLALVGRTPDFEVEQDQPDRQRPSRFDERFIERLPDNSRSAGEMKTYRRLNWRHLREGTSQACRSNDLTSNPSTSKFTGGTLAQERRPVTNFTDREEIARAGAAVDIAAGTVLV